MYYPWGQYDDLYLVAGRVDLWQRSGWASPDVFAQQITLWNPSIIVWSRVPPGTLVYLPFSS